MRGNSQGSTSRRLVAALVLGSGAISAATFPPPPTDATTATRATARPVGTMIPVPPPHPNLHGTTAAPATASVQPGAILATTGQNFAFFDSGLQQCQLGKYKIIYRYVLQPVSNLADHPNAVWAMRYELRSETRSGNNWVGDTGLYALDWSITYQGGQKPAESGRDTQMQGQGVTTVAHAFAWGDDLTPMASVSITISRSGLAHGMHKAWGIPARSSGNACDPG